MMMMVVVAPGNWAFSMFLGGAVVKNLSANVGDAREHVQSQVGKTMPPANPGAGNGKPSPSSCQENSRDRAAW